MTDEVSETSYEGPINFFDDPVQAPEVNDPEIIQYDDDQDKEFEAGNIQDTDSAKDNDETADMTINPLEITEVRKSNLLKRISIKVGDKTICTRYFSPMQAGSLRASIFSLSILCIGIGTLSLPKKFDEMEWY